MIGKKWHLLNVLLERYRLNALPGGGTSLKFLSGEAPDAIEKSSWNCV